MDFYSVLDSSNYSPILVILPPSVLKSPDKLEGGVDNSRRNPPPPQKKAQTNPRHCLFRLNLSPP